MKARGYVLTRTLTKMMDDLTGLVEHQKSICAETEIGIVATSLAGRVALKMVSFDKPNSLSCDAGAGRGSAAYAVDDISGGSGR